MDDIFPRSQGRFAIRFCLQVFDSNKLHHLVLAHREYAQKTEGKVKPEIALCLFRVGSVIALFVF